MTLRTQFGGLRGGMASISGSGGVPRRKHAGIDSNCKSETFRRRGRYQIFRSVSAGLPGSNRRPLVLERSQPANSVPTPPPSCTRHAKMKPLIAWHTVGPARWANIPGALPTAPRFRQPSRLERSLSGNVKRKVFVKVVENISSETK